MELTKYHRQELVNQLSKAEHEYQNIQYKLSNVKGGENECILEVQHVLVQSRIDVIKKALIDGEMDY